MRMQILKIVVVLLVAGSGDTRPQNGADSTTQAETRETSNVGWRGVRASNKTSQDVVRDDSRYTGTSGSNRKPYVTYFRDSVDSSRGHSALGSRTSGPAPNGTARSFSARRSKINDIWTRPEFKATGAPSGFSRTDVLGEIGALGAVRNSSGPSLHGPLSNHKTIHGEKIGWVKSVSASNRSSDLDPGRTNHPEKVTTKNLEGWRSDVTLNQSFRSMVTQVKYSPVGNDFLASRASGFDRTNDDISSTTKNRQKSDLVRSNLSSNKNIRGNISRRKTEQGLNIFSSQVARTDVPSNFQEGALTHLIHKSRNSIRKNTDKTDSTVTSYENLKPSVVTDSFRRADGLNDSGKSSHGVETLSTLSPNSKSGIAGHSRPASHRNAVTSNRNFVRLRYPFSASNRRNASNVALNTKLKNNNVRPSAVQLAEPTKYHFAQADAKRPDLTLDPTKNSHSSHFQNSPSQANETGDAYGATSAQHDVHLKNWPNEALQDIEDLYNYEKYTSALEKDSNHDSGPQDADVMPILSSDGDYFNHPDPILDSSVKKIIYWLKIPAIVPNGTHYANNNDDVRKPVESVLESIYENLEPNRPLGIGAHDNNYETVVLQNAAQNQDFDRIDYHGNYPPNRWTHPNLVVRPQYVTNPSNPSAILTPSSWSDVALLKNKTVYNPLTHVTQNTVVHILNDGLKEPNVTVTQSKVPESGQTASSGSSSEPSSELAQRPNVHVMFTSQKDENKGPSKQETNTSPSSTHNINCPTITINTYTRVNNTIQSKEGCTDLNIVVNSHVTSTNVFEPNGEDQQTSLATQGYGDAVGSDKYAEGIDDLAHQDSLNGYVTASTGTYGPSPLETPGPGDYYDSQKDPAGIPGHEKDPLPGSSTVEVFQGTQISVSGSNMPLTDNAEATAGPVLTGADGPAGSSVDGPAVGDDASSSAANPPAAGASASGSPVAGNPSSINSPVSANVPSVATELPVYLVRPGPVKGQANNGLVPGSLQLPSLPNLPSRPSLSVKPGLPSAGSLSSASSTQNDDDDDDDDFDMSSGGLLQSMTSVFTYFAFLNPLGYSFFSLAAAPFAAMAAGVLGVAAIVFPWALPNVLDFGRAADRVTIRFRPNLEEFVRQAVHKYDRLNEWKSRRRKRRR